MFSRAITCLLAAFAAVCAQGINPDSLPVWKGSESMGDSAAHGGGAMPAKSALRAAGSKSLQTSIGSGGADVQQELRLSISGEAADGVFIDAYLLDLGRPAGAEVTASLRETDAAYIGIESKAAKLELGDLNYEMNESGLWELRRKTLGVGGKLRGGGAEAGAVYGSDRTERRSAAMAGRPSQQKGYPLLADSAFGAIVPGTERVYLNGALLEAGRDYEINYAGGILDFLGRIIPGPEDEIRVEYDSYSPSGSSELRAAEAAWRSKFIWLDLAAFNLRDSLRSDKIGSARARAGGARFFADLEIATNEQESKALRWVLESDSNSVQKSAAKVSIKGGFAGSAFAKEEYGGGDKAWDAFALRDKWLMDSVPSGDLRYDELEAVARLPLGFYPGLFAGHRNFKSFRGEAFARRETEAAASEVSLAGISAASAERGEAGARLLQGELRSRFLRGSSRPYGALRFDSHESARALSGLELGDKNSSFANLEIQKEGTDTSDFSSFKTFASINSKHWHSSTLFQIRQDERASWLLDQSAGYSNPGAFMQGDASYAFNYTDEVPWTPIYRRVPDGAGDVYYDSLSGQYIAGADNGNFVYEGMGRADSLAKRNYKSDLRWNLSFHPDIILSMISTRKGFLNDVSFFASGEWLLHSGERLILLDNSALWESPKDKSSLMLAVSSKRDKEPQISFEENSFGLSASANYKGRQKEDLSAKAKREEADFPASDLNWLSWQGELSWLREIGKGFSLGPFCSGKYTEGFYSSEPWNAALRQGGIIGKWQSEQGSMASADVSGNHVEKSSSVSPYSATDGFEGGFSWRASALAQISFGDSFRLSAHYVIRAWRGQTIQKLSSEARAMF